MQARGPKKHLKRIAAPKSWMLSKLGGIYTVRPSQGPHKLRESVPLAIILQHKLKVALYAREVKMILRERDGQIRINGKYRRDPGFPVGIGDVVSIDKTKQNFRVLYDVAGRFILKSVTADEAKFKLAKVTQKKIGPNNIPYIVTNDSRTIRYPHPDIHVNDTVKIDLDTGKVTEFIKQEAGNLAYLLGGNNIGRVGLIQHREQHLGSFDIIHIKDSNGKSFATRIGNVFVIGKGNKPLISLPDDHGLYLSALEKKELKEKENKVDDE
ncbi:hypothetical protein pb186bvf_012001 [Paramecium bursaria]